MPDAPTTKEDRLEIRNTAPATGESLPPVAMSTAAEVRRTVERARAAQGEWASKSWKERGRLLLRLRDAVIERSDELFEALARESGKPRFEAYTHEVMPIIDFIHYFATRAESILADESLPLHLFGPLKQSTLCYEPRGVIGVIAPWNFPFTIPMGDVIMALAAGNGVVVKPSEWTPRIFMKAKEIIDDAGIDPDLVGVVQGDGRVGQALIESDVDMMIFTGSVATGRKVAAACGARLIPCVTELGGKDPAIVLDDADVAFTAKLLAWGAFANCGQVCASVERVLVHESLYEPLVARVVEIAQSLRQGDSLRDPFIDLGPMVVPNQLEIVQRHVDDAVARGARVLTGGRPSPGPGRFYPPTVLVDVTPEMECWKSETFGPTLPIRRFTSEEQAIAEANQSEYGLSAYVFSRSPARAEAVARRLQAGTVMINDVLYTHALPEAPWGGVKHSGVGRVHGIQALREMCEVKHIGKPRVKMTPPWLYPYTEGRFNLIRGGLDRLFRGTIGRFL